MMDQDDHLLDKDKDENESSNLAGQHEEKEEEKERKMLLTSSMGRTIWLANKKDIPVPRPFSTCNCQPLKNLICSFIIDHSYNKLQLSTFEILDLFIYY